MLDLSFLNKNLYRRYPIRTGASGISVQGREIPLTLFCAARFVSDSSHLDVHISKIVIEDENLNVTIMSGSTCLGYFNSKITRDYQTLKMTPVARYASGYLTVGKVDALGEYQGINTFNTSNAKIEDSLVVCKAPPGVSGIKVGETIVKGMVTFTYENISETVNANDELLTLGIVNVNLILSKNDLSSTLENCPTKYISSVHGVTPDNDGNIDIYGIQPLSVQITADNDIVLATPGIEFFDICQNKKNIVPPIPANSPNDYQDVLSITKEEWKTWPDYAPFYP
jgi:hypothetical protein